MFGSRSGFSGSADRMALLPVGANPRWRPSVVLEIFEWPYFCNGSCDSLRVWFYDRIFGSMDRIRLDQILADICIPISSVVGRWQLQSANSGTLIVPGTRTTISRRNLAVSRPGRWNRLPVELRTSSLSIDTFTKKTHISLV